ncbi:Tmem107, partial [Symbiodinium microadriaticum]
MPEALRLGGIVSYFTQEGGSVGLSSLWPRIANATRANHQAFATLAGVPYKQITWGHRRCGKMRAVAEALKCIPPGAWLFFIDADAAFRAQTEPCTARDPLSPAMVSFHATIFRDRHFLHLTSGTDENVKESEDEAYPPLDGLLRMLGTAFAGSWFLATTGQLIAVLTVLLDKEPYIQAALPVLYTREEYDAADGDFTRVLVLCTTCLTIELASFLVSGVTLFANRVNAAHCVFHIAGAVGISIFSMGRNHFGYLWYLFVLTGLLPLL